MKTVEELLKKNGNSQVTTIPLLNVTHDYHTLKEGNVWALADPKEDFSKEALEQIIKWLNINKF
ncbi:MAG TPA: hypothetical protein DIT07_14660 [Sphingobacteriaceae bacterium]|nr:hypothetical protein [Sphingobacteriaceae bacterium]